MSHVALDIIDIYRDYFLPLLPLAFGEMGCAGNELASGQERESGQLVGDKWDEPTSPLGVRDGGYRMQLANKFEFKRFGFGIYCRFYIIERLTKLPISFL